MKVARAIVIGLLFASVLALGGCKKKKPATPPPQATAPTITEPAPQPAPPAPAETQPQPAPQPAAPETKPSTEVTKPKPKKPRTKIAHKTPAPKPAEKPSRTVVEGGSVPSNGQLSATMPNDSAVHQKFTTAQLLEATDYNLKNISRPLNADEQAMVQHIRNYMAQSRQATQDGDTERAYNLALKAHLLSDELVKQ